MQPPCYLSIKQIMEKTRDNANGTIHFSFSFLRVNFSMIIMVAGTHEKPETGRGGYRKKSMGLLD